MTETNSHGSAKIDLSALSADELKTVEDAATKDARAEQREAELARIEAMLEPATRTAFGALRTTKEEFSPPDVRLMLEVLDRIATLAALKLEVVRVRGASVNEGGGV